MLVLLSVVADNSANGEKKSSTPAQTFLNVFSLATKRHKSSVVELDGELEDAGVVAGGGDAAEVAGVTDLTSD